MKTLFTWGTSSFGFSFFKWFFSASGKDCLGWDGFPTFGLQALKWTWHYDFSLTYIGVGALQLPKPSFFVLCEQYYHSKARVYAV